MVQLLWKTAWWFFKKLNIITIWSYCHICTCICIYIYTKELKKAKYLYTNVCINPSHNSQKVKTTQMSIHKWMHPQAVLCHTMNCICMHIYALEKIQLQKEWGHDTSHHTTCMNYKDIKPGKRSLTHKTMYYLMLFIRNVQNRSAHKDEKQISSS